jgi:hypothetical protein
MEGILFLLVIFGLPLLIYIGLVAASSAVAKPMFEAQHERDVERDMRREVSEANLRQQIARKLLDEYDVE